ncbi:hypothetical protein BH20CHL7_BH20CHL7_15220 [soil metagenome]
MARAKSTARAEARRRHRADHGLNPQTMDDVGDGAEIGATSGSRASHGGAAAGAALPQGRIGIGESFRRSFRPLDVRGDLRDLPWIATRTKALWIPIALTLVSTAVFYATQGEDIVTRFVFAYFIQTPAIGGVFLAGFLAPKASWLLGVIVGLVSAACYAFLLLTVFAAVAAASPTPGIVQDAILSGFLLSPVMGALFASAAAWYRRFLNLSSPNRGRQRPAAKRGPDGKSRGGSQKASARR